MGLISYIIRIYRQDDSDPCLMVGIVEDAETNVKQRFTTFEELKGILAPTKRCLLPKMGKSPTKRQGR